MAALVLVVAGGIGVAVAVTGDDESGDDDAGRGEAPTSPSPPSTTEMPSDPATPTSPTSPALGAERDGRVTVLGAFTGVDQQGLEASLAAFERRSGIEVEYVPDVDINVTLKTRVAAGDPPGVGLLPTPTLLPELVESDAVTPIENYLDVETLEETLVPGLLDTAVVDGTAYAAPVRVVNKSLVWYPRRAFEAAGYREPRTLAQLTRLTRRIERDGTTPWCMAWGAASATGWVGSDWLEQLVLTREGPDFYRQWVAHDVPFDAPEVVAALDAFAEIAKDESAVGPTDDVLIRQVQESMLPAFDDPPGCLLERQGSFEPQLLPPEIAADGELGVFAFPPATGGGPAPILGGGDLATLLDPADGDAVELLQFLTSDDFGAEWAATGAYLSPHRTFDVGAYPDPTTRRVGELTASAPEIVVDASDVMPADLGATAFWPAMVEWLDGASSADALAAVEDAWPQ